MSFRPYFSQALMNWLKSRLDQLKPWRREDTQKKKTLWVSGYFLLLSFISDSRTRCLSDCSWIYKQCPLLVALKESYKTPIKCVLYLSAQNIKEYRQLALHFFGGVRENQRICDLETDNGTNKYNNFWICFKDAYLGQEILLFRNLLFCERISFINPLLFLFSDLARIW